jgi:acyl-coenzyme A thioesterase PaaI-like protein
LVTLHAPCTAGRPRVRDQQPAGYATIDDVADPLVEMMNAGMASTIPTAHQMGVQVLEARRGFAAASVPAEGNGNHFGVIYAGVQFTVAEILGGIIALATFDASKYFPLVKNLDIAFRGMATTALRAEASMDEETIARVEAEAAAQGKADYLLDAVVTDAAGAVVATTHGLYQLRAQRS